MDRAEDAAQVRTERLASELAAAHARLADAERARAEDAGRLAALEAEVARAREVRAMFAWKLAAPLIGLERGLRWLGDKAMKVGGLLARQVVFRGRS